MTEKGEAHRSALVVVEQIDRGPDAEQASATVVVGGHRVRLVVQHHPALGMTEHVQVPEALQLHQPTLSAVVRSLARFLRGESISLPVDLSDEVRATGQTSPLERRSAAEQRVLDLSADAVDLVRVRGTRDPVQPNRVTLEVRLRGAAMVMTADVYEAPNAVSFLRWRSGPPLESLSAAERYALERLFVAELRAA